MKIYLHLMTAYYRDSGALTLVRVLTRHGLLPVFPGSHLQAPERVGFKLWSGTQIATRISQGLPLIFILVSS